MGEKKRAVLLSGTDEQTGVAQTQRKERDEELFSVMLTPT